MKVWTSLFNYIAIFLIILMLPSYYSLSKALDKEFDQLRLDMQVDNASEALLYAATSVDDIELDYINPDAIIVSPGQSIDLFSTVMCFGYDMQPTAANKNAIQASVCAMVLSDEYGYYIAELVEDDTSPSNGVKFMDYVLRWSPRICYYDKYEGKSITYSYSYYPLLVNEPAGTIDGHGIFVDKVPIDSDNAQNRDYIRSRINSQISASIEAEIERRNKNSSFDFKFYLPYETTTLGVNPIKGPSALVFINNASYASNYKLDSVNVGGYMVQQKQYIVCFIENGVKYYCYQQQLPVGRYGSIETYVDTQKEACDLGYLPHYEYLSRYKYANTLHK